MSNLSRQSYKIFFVAIFLFASFAAQAKTTTAPEVVTSVSESKMQGILQDIGIDSSKLKENTFKFKFDDYPVILFNKERNMQLYAGFKAKASIEKVNEWNKTHRFSRAYIDGEGDPVIEADLDFDGGVPVDAIKEFIKTFRLSVTAFVKFLKE
ncbi:MAG: YbjN domain-containing protein [Pyrinomonadaceae bacterium]